MSYVLVVRYRPVRETPLALSERPWVRVLRTLNEYQARLFVAEKALQLEEEGPPPVAVDRNVAGRDY